MKKIIIGILLLTAGLAWAVPPRDPALLAQYEQSSIAKLERKSTQETMTVGKRKTFPKVPVILVSYQDIKYRISKAEIDSMFNAKYRAKGSVKAYFTAQSDSAYSPQFDIYGPVTVSKGTSSYANNAPALVKEACSLMNDSLDFAQYDSDNDGKVDLVYILYAGPPASDENYIDPTWLKADNLIWPHYHVTSSSKIYDGKSIADYEVSSELTGVESNADTAVIADLGLACHEFGHGLGLPDIYNTSTYSHKTLGVWDIMDYGCYSVIPANYTIYERWFMGWSTPRLINEAENVTLIPIAKGGEGLIITRTGESNLNGLNPSPAEFWLLENRQQESWDYSIPGHGLLIYHVKYDASTWNKNQLNISATNQHFDLIEADGKAPAYSDTDTTYAWYGKPGDAFPAGATSYTPYGNYDITEIQENDGIITFKFMGGTTTKLNDNWAIGRDSKKVLINGTIYIRRNEHLYNSMGQIVK